MRRNYILIRNLSCLSFILIFLIPYKVSACSTFKLQKGDSLIYGHNLNQGDIGVPGLIFINKRGIFKTGRTWSELITKEQLNPSSHYWISRYGSITFNVFGKDLPDGGMNEVHTNSSMQIEYIWSKKRISPLKTVACQAGGRSYTFANAFFYKIAYI